MKNTIQHRAPSSFKKLGKKQAGLTAIEMVIGLVVLSLLAAAITPVVLGALEGFKAESEITAMKDSGGKILKRYERDVITTSLDNDEVIVAELFSKAYSTSGTSNLFNRFGGSIDINGVDSNGLTWESTKIPQGQCETIVLGMSGYIFENVAIGTTNIQYSNTNPSAITTACNSAAGSTDIVTLTWTKLEI
ncbi:MAG: hypothetical protein HAW67_00325 [Endozoicomonadaceae bacterium]|nr:hypothetical protein [Endozoicomonadaceae bacterium]